MKKPTTKQKPNVALLRKIQKAILKYPDQFNMAWWFQKKDSKGNLAGRCGTAACIAGWAVTLARVKNIERAKPFRKQLAYQRVIWDLPGDASNLLGLQTESETNGLFCTSSWPAKFRKRYDHATTAKQAARAASDRISHFIKTGK